MPEGAMWDPETQTLPREKLARLQTDRLGTLIERIWEQPVPFLQRKLERSGISRADSLQLSDLARIEDTRKDELRASEAAHPPFGDYRTTKLHHNVRIGTTGGTSGTPTTVLWTKRDLRQDDAAGARMFWRQGMRPGMIVANSHPLSIYGGGRSVVGVMESFGALVLAVGPPETDDDARRAIELWLRCKPHAYQMFPSAYRKYYETALAMGLDPSADLNLRPPSENPELAYRTITAGSECFQYLGSACSEGGGAHICEDMVVLEVVDDSGSPVADGERGLMVATTLNRDNFTLRYNLEDLVRVNPEHDCECGETHRRFMWEGRLRDLVTVGDARILPGEIAGVLFGFDSLRRPTLEYQVVRRRGTRGEDRLHVRVESIERTPAVVDEVASALASRFGVDVDAELVERGALPRPAYKPERVVDEP